MVVGFLAIVRGVPKIVAGVAFASTSLV
jgi:hypothetical protein